MSQVFLKNISLGCCIAMTSGVLLAELPKIERNPSLVEQLKTDLRKKNLPKKEEFEDLCDEVHVDLDAFIDALKKVDESNSLALEKEAVQEAIRRIEALLATLRFMSAFNHSEGCWINNTRFGPIASETEPVIERFAKKLKVHKELRDLFI